MLVQDHACILPTWSHLILSHNSIRQILYHLPFFTHEKTKLKLVKPVVWSQIAQHQQFDSRDHACDSCTLLAFHLAVTYQALRASAVNKKSIIPDFKELSVCLSAAFRPCIHYSLCLQCSSYNTPFYVQPRWFLLTLKTEIRHHLPQPFLTAWGVPGWCLTYACEQRQHCLVVRVLSLHRLGSNSGSITSKHCNFG